MDVVVCLSFCVCLRCFSCGDYAMCWCFVQKKTYTFMTKLENVLSFEKKLSSTIFLFFAFRVFWRISDYKSKLNSTFEIQEHILHDITFKHIIWLLIWMYSKTITNSWIYLTNIFRKPCWSLVYFFKLLFIYIITIIPFLKRFCMTSAWHGLHFNIFIIFK